MRKLLIAFLAGLALSGCATQNGAYTTGMSPVPEPAVSRLAPMAVGAFDATGPEIHDLNVRGASLLSPHGANYADYLQHALRADLMRSGLLDEQSKTRVTGTLIRNRVDADGTKIGIGDLVVRFRVTRDDTTVYEREVAEYIEWESAFTGAIALREAVANYPRLVQRLLLKLYSDPELIKVAGR
jgi:hypothetical protein